MICQNTKYVNALDIEIEIVVPQMTTAVHCFHFYDLSSDF